MGYEFILYEKAGGVGRLTLNRPERLNALIPAMGLELLDALDDCERDDAVRVLVFTGAGRGFCAGDDMKGAGEPGGGVGAGRNAAGWPGAAPDAAARPRPDDPLRQYVYGPGRWVTVVRQMMRLPRPIVGVINGHAHGAGFNLALACDFRIISEAATLCVPFVKWGMATGTNRLQQFVGVGKALEWALLGKTLTPQEADHWGLATTVVPPAQLEAATAELVARLVQAPTRALAATKAAVYRGWERDPDTAYEYQGLAQALVRDTADVAEGRRAFREKRAPRFTGQ